MQHYHQFTFKCSTITSSHTNVAIYYLFTFRENNRHSEAALPPVRIHEKHSFISIPSVHIQEKHSFISTTLCSHSGKKTLHIHQRYPQFTLSKKKKTVDIQVALLYVDI